MAIAANGGSSVNNATGTTLTPDISLQLAPGSGDISFVTVHVQGDKTASMNCTSSGSVWITLLAPVYDAGSDMTMAIYYQIFASDVDPTVSWTGSANFGYFMSTYSATLILTVQLFGPVTNNDGDQNIECPQGITRIAVGDLCILTEQNRGGFAITESTGYTAVSAGVFDTNGRYAEIYKANMSATENPTDMTCAGGTPANSRCYGIVISESSASPPSTLVPAVYILT